MFTAQVLSNEKIQEHPRAHDPGAVMRFQIEQVWISDHHEPCATFNRRRNVLSRQDLVAPLNERSAATR